METPTQFPPPDPQSPPQPVATSAALILPQLPGVGEVLRESWQAYVRRFWTYLIISVTRAAAAGAVLAGFYIEYSHTLRALGGVSGVIGILFGYYPAHDVITPGFIGVGIAAGIALAFIVLWASVASIAAAVTPEEGNAWEGARRAYAAAWERLAENIGVGVLSGLAFLGGFILLIVPGFVFVLWFAFAPFILMTEEGVGVMDSLRKSRDLVRGRTWEVAKYFIAFMFIVGVVSKLNGMIAGMLGGGPNGGIQNALDSITLLVLNPLGVVYGYTVYLALKKAPVTRQV